MEYRYLIGEIFPGSTGGCYGLNHTLKKIVEVLTPPYPVPMNVTLFGNNVLADAQIKIRSLEWALTQ